MTDSKKVTSIFTKSKTNKNIQLTPVEQQAGNALLEAISAFDADNKKYESHI